MALRDNAVRGKNELVKTQRVRLMDVFLLGPFMVFAAVKLHGAGHRKTAALMAVAGIGTSAYNARNYLRVRR